jgi:enoyl-CoA hydratase/carnithine racemase
MNRPKPTLAVIPGPAAGAGLSLALASWRCQQAHHLQFQ